MALNRVAFPNVNPVDLTDWAKMIDLIEALSLKINLPVDYDFSGDTIKKGTIIMIGGTIYLADSDTAITGSTSDFVKITPSGATATAAYVANLSGVSWNDTYNFYEDVSNNAYIFDEAKAFLVGTYTDPQTVIGRFGTPFMHVQEQYSSGFDIAGSPSSGWNIRLLNTTLKNTIVGASLSSNQIILPAGVYKVKGRAFGFGFDSCRVRLRNITDGSDPSTLFGLTDFSASNAAWPEVEGEFTITDTKTFELQQVADTLTFNGRGLSSGILGIEVYSDLQLWKIA